MARGPSPRLGVELENAVGGWPSGGLVAVCGVGRTRVVASALATARGWAQVDARARAANETAAGRMGGGRSGARGRARAELAPGLTHDRDAAFSGPVAWVDPGRRLFPPGLARLGVDLERLLWVTPANVTDAIWATHVLLSAGGFGRIALDLPGDRLDHRLERAVQRLQRDAEGSATSAFLLTPEAPGGVALTVACREEAGALAVSWQWRRGGGGGVGGRRAGELRWGPGRTLGGLGGVRGGTSSGSGAELRRALLRATT